MTEPHEGSASIAQNLKWFHKKHMVPYISYKIVESSVYFMQNSREFCIPDTIPSRVSYIQYEILKGPAVQRKVSYILYETFASSADH